MGSLQPTYKGFVETRQDVLTLIQACNQGHLRMVHTHPDERARPCMAQSGHVFLWEKRASGIRRWMDGARWTASRGLGAFYIYAERAPETARSELKSRQASETSNGQRVEEPMSLEWETRLYGNLRRSFDIKPDGLIKKAISIEDFGESGLSYHMVSYYRPVDVLQGRLRTPSMDESFASHVDTVPNPIPFPRPLSFDDQQVLSNCGLPPLYPYPQPDSSTPTVWYPVQMEWKGHVYQVPYGFWPTPFWTWLGRV